MPSQNEGERTAGLKIFDRYVGIISGCKTLYEKALLSQPELTVPDFFKQGGDVAILSKEVCGLIEPIEYIRYVPGSLVTLPVIAGEITIAPEAVTLADAFIIAYEAFEDGAWRHRTMPLRQFLKPRMNAGRRESPFWPRQSHRQLAKPTPRAPTTDQLLSMF